MVTGGYSKLDIYNDAKSMAIRIHQITLSLPKFEMFEEGSQIRRSSKSVAANIVEGFNRRRYKADYIKHLIYAHAESDETILHLDFLFETKSMTNESLYKELREGYFLLGKRINAFIEYLSRQP